MCIVQASFCLLHLWECGAEWKTFHPKALHTVLVRGSSATLHKWVVRSIERQGCKDRRQISCNANAELTYTLVHIWACVGYRRYNVKPSLSLCHDNVQHKHCLWYIVTITMTPLRDERECYEVASRFVRSENRRARFLRWRAARLRQRVRAFVVGRAWRDSAMTAVFHFV